MTKLERLKYRSEYYKNNREKVDVYHQKYIESHREQIRAYQSKYYRTKIQPNPELIEKQRKRSRDWWVKHPYYRKYDRAMNRHRDREGYAKLEFTATREDFKNAWYRDQAYDMKFPETHRKNNDIGYTADNICFVEHDEHIHFKRKRS
jgi:hypothetical protein